MQLIRDISLFSPQVLAKRHHRALLLQFILAELLGAYQAFLKENSWETILSTHPRFFPYDWAKSPGYLNKLREHAMMLKKSFPDFAKQAKQFEQFLEKTLRSWEKKKTTPKQYFKHTLQKIYLLIEALLETCKDNENLIFFLLKNNQTIDALMHPGYLRTFLTRVHPSGLEILGEKMCDQYHRRGFISQIPELKLLMTNLIHA
jgi:hypothetical protein